jgi:hypothetical protein
MNAKWLAVALLFVVAGHARAQVDELYDANVIERTAGLDWLETLARSDEDSASDGALYALALHRSPDASQRLYKLALNSDDDSTIAALTELLTR